jgi:hypothetical protein
VQFESLKKHLKHFLSWKEEIGEPIGENDPLFLGGKPRKPSAVPPLLETKACMQEKFNKKAFPSYYISIS